MNTIQILRDQLALAPEDSTLRGALIDAIADEYGDIASATAQADDIRVRARIASFVTFLDETLQSHFAEQQYSFAPPTHHAEFISDKWCRIVRDGSVVAFVALKNNTTRTLGVVRVGGIYKPASWKVPAKHARGSIFEDFSKSVGGTGHVNYLR